MGKVTSAADILVAIERLKGNIENLETKQDGFSDRVSHTNDHIEKMRIEAKETHAGIYRKLDELGKENVRIEKRIDNKIIASVSLTLTTLAGLIWAYIKG